MNQYQLNEVTIGRQVWMTKNLNVAKFRNGDPIPEVNTNEEWKKAEKNKQPAWCYYDNDPKNGEKYGKLYNWYAVNDPRQLAPVGYHIPANAEWDILFDCLGGEEIGVIKMKSTSDWDDDRNGTNESGFSGLPGGYRDAIGIFHYVGITGQWWCSSERNEYYAYSRFLGLENRFFVSSQMSYKECGKSVRCLRY